MTSQQTLVTGADVVGPHRLERRTSVRFSTRVLQIGSGASRAGQRRRNGEAALRVDGRGCFLSPGFIDLHTHGAVGVDFVTANREEFERAMAFYARQGVTALLASVYPTAWTTLQRTVERLAGFIRDSVGGGVAVGLHLEGPYLNPDRPGALPKRHFRKYRARDLERLLDAGGGLVRTMTVAPESHDGMALVRHLLLRRVIPAFGHSAADYATTRSAVKAGVRYATHLFNAMEGMHHRSPGAALALLESDPVFVEVIADGHHVHVPMLQLIRREKPAERVILISDSAPPCGLPEGDYRFAGAQVRLQCGRVTLPDGTLAGSALTLPRAVRLYARQVGVPIDEAFRAASDHPARALGDRRRGRIAVGRRADLVLVDRQFRVRATWLGGRLLYAARGVVRDC